MTKIAVELPEIPRDPMREPPKFEECNISIINPWQV